jgi:hypothetical protein
VPIAGSSVEAHGLRFEAEDVAGRRNKIHTVLIRRAVHDRAAQPADEEELVTRD